MQNVPVRRERRWRAGLDLAAVLALFEWLLWMGDGPYVVSVRLTVALVILAIMGAAYRRRPLPCLSLRPGGQHPAAARKAWLVTLAITGLAALTLVVFGRLMTWWVGGMHLDLAFTGRGAARLWAGKLVVVAAQQLALQLFFLPRCHEFVGRRGTAVVLAAAIFGALHLPNPLLATLAVMAALVWCGLYLHTGRVAPLVFSHLFLALVARAACGDAIYHMRVGASVRPLLPRAVLAADGEALRVVPRAIEGYLDRCTVEGVQATCYGWAADIDRRRPAAGIVVLAAGAFHRYPLARQPRPDVAAEFGLPSIESSGFRIDLPAAWLAAPERARFFAAAADGTNTELEYLWPEPTPGAR